MEQPDDTITVMLCGPMTGLPDWNFPAFHRAAKIIKARGYRVLNPAETDGGSTDKPWTHYMRHSLSLLVRADAVVVLEGWEKSRGATIEVDLARALEMPIFDLSLCLIDAEWREAREGKAVEGREQSKVEGQEDILEEALRITRGDRQASYGPPDQDFTRTAKLWTAWKGVEFEARDVAVFMILLKASRESHQRKRDNWVDIAGYARCGSLCNPA